MRKQLVRHRETSTLDANALELFACVAQPLLRYRIGAYGSAVSPLAGPQA